MTDVSTHIDQDVTTFIENVGRAKLATELGVSESQISNQKKRGQLPSSWFFVCQEIVERDGLEVDEDRFRRLFSFKEVTSPEDLRHSQPEAAQ
ncbi:hypothetical protein QEZ52_00430 [Aliisedimentitalea scapharcae]|uniref:YdaS antitoxin of YdaST toxin-antitoxin system n=1 Tax=Aliisedimentitalea scapharcae TaxID=1524259 RepID=A0ABZ2XSI6_9RHOB